MVFSGDWEQSGDLCDGELLVERFLGEFLPDKT